MISKMLERLEKLLNGVAVQRALSVQSIDHNEVVRLAELRVVRECNLPDSYTTFLDVSRKGKYKKINDKSRHFYCVFPFHGSIMFLTANAK